MVHSWSYYSLGYGSVVSTGNLGCEFTCELIGFIIPRALEVVHSAAILGMIYHFSITLAHFTGIFPQNSYFLSVTNVVENIVALLVQSFFSFRVYRLSQRFSVGLVCWSLTTARFISGICVAVESILDVPRVPNGIIVITKFGWLITLTFVLGGLVDVVIAAMQVWYLRGAVRGLHDVRFVLAICFFRRCVVTLLFQDSCDIGKCYQLVLP
jgi:hypothetical protein